MRILFRFYYFVTGLFTLKPPKPPIDRSMDSEEWDDWPMGR